LVSERMGRWLSMAFPANLRGRPARAGEDLPGTPARRFVRNRMLGTEALYELLDDCGELITAQVLEAPGLAPGMRLRLLRSATRAMEQIDPQEPLFAARLAPHGPCSAA
jgi:hypothetical protein